MQKPIFVVGAARSGTTMLAEMLERHPDVAYWIEPKYIWRYRNPRAHSDVRTAEEATPAVQRYIRRRFQRYLERHGGSRFMEKTPSSCFRVPFMDRVFPDGLFVNIVRDGRDVAFSARRKWTSPLPKGVLARRATSFEVPLRDAPSYAFDVVRDVLGRSLLPEKGYIWGPNYPGMREFRAGHSVLETCAMQWRRSVEAEREGLAVVPAVRRLTFRFEDFVRDPAPVMGQILDFLELRRVPEVIEHAAATADPEAIFRWRSKDPEEIAAAERWIAPTLLELGYEPPGATGRAPTARGPEAAG